LRRLLNSSKLTKPTFRTTADGNPASISLDLLTTAYSYATLGEKVVSLVTKLEFCGLAFGRLDKSFGDKLIQNSSFVRLQIRAGAVQ
jgi:hypothetical protein